MVTIKHEDTDEIVCPYCGYTYSDSWEFGDEHEDLGLMLCKQCDKDFYATRHTSITYCTEKARYGKCKNCNAENVVIEDYHASIGSYKDLCLMCGSTAKKKFREDAIRKYIKATRNK